MQRPRFDIPPEQIEFVPIRARGAGGQHVNKVSSAVQLRFDIQASSLPEELRARLLALGDQRISQDGVLVIKAQQFRSQARNRIDAIQRLEALLEKAAHVPKTRRPTRPGKGAVRARLEAKGHRAQLKAMRQAPGRREDDA